MNITSTNKAPAKAYTLTIKLPRLSGQQANDAIWTGVDRFESAGESAKTLAADRGPGLTETLGRTLKFGAISAVPVIGIKFGRQVKAGIDQGRITAGETAHWSNAAIGAGQVAGLGLGAAAVGSMLTGIGSASALGIASAAGFGIATLGGMVLTNSTSPDQLSVAFVQKQG